MHKCCFVRACRAAYAGVRRQVRASSHAGTKVTKWPGALQVRGIRCYLRTGKVLTVLLIASGVVEPLPCTALMAVAGALHSVDGGGGGDGGDGGGGGCFGSGATPLQSE